MAVLAPTDCFERQEDMKARACGLLNPKVQGYSSDHFFMNAAEQPDPMPYRKALDPEDSR